MAFTYSTCYRPLSKKGEDFTLSSDASVHTLLKDEKMCVLEPPLPVSKIDTSDSKDHLFPARDTTS